MKTTLLLGLALPGLLAALPPVSAGDVGATCVAATPDGCAGLQNYPHCSVTSIYLEEPFYDTNLECLFPPPPPLDWVPEPPLPAVPYLLPCMPRPNWYECFHLIEFITP